MKQTIAIFLLMSILGQAQADTTQIYQNIRRSEAFRDEDLMVAMQYATTAVDLAMSQSDLKPKVNALSQAGKLCFYAGLFDRAVDYFNRALILAEQSGDMILLADEYLNLGGVHNMLGDYSRSRELTEKGFQTFLKHYRERREPIPADILFYYSNNMGLLFMKEGKTKEARDFFLEAIKRSKDSESKDEYTRPMTGLADLFISTGQLDTARQLLTELLQYHQIHGVKAGLTVALALMGDLYVKQKDLEQALSFYRRSLQIATDRKDLFVQERVTEDIAEVYQSKGMSDSALFYFEQHHRLSASSEKMKAIQSLKQRDLENRLREQEQESIRRIRIERTILGILAGGSLGLLFFLLIRSRKRTVLERMEAALREEKLRLEKKLLQETLDLKDKQLATQVMYSLQKNEMVTELVSRIKETAAQSPDSQKSPLNRIIRQIEAGSAEPWKEFEQRFQEVHTGFYERLMVKYPDLTSNERRICAFLRLDMSTKEISNLTGQSVKAITQARFRLRSKLNIDNPDTSLFEVLMQV
ncbi:MAG: tetratricopeptide repeat protein [Chitinophagaceae bacterium]|jgi:tetratricopeptide (TPR) repeat protein